MEEHFQFDRDRFKDVVHHAVHYAACTYGSEVLGSSKLHKALYLAEMLHYLDTGRPLTGEDYHRQRFGPAARHLSWGVGELEAAGRISISTRNYYGYARTEYLSLTAQAVGSLSQQQTQLVEQMVRFVCGDTACEIGEFNLQEAWTSVPVGNRIPYYAAYAMFPAEVSDEDIEDAAREALEMSAAIEAEQQDGPVH